MYSGDEAYDAALHYFQVLSLNRPDIQGGPKRYFRHLQAALIYAASLTGEGNHVWVLEREVHDGKEDKWKAFWWSKLLQEEYDVQPHGRGWGLSPTGALGDGGNVLNPYVPLDPQYRSKTEMIP